MAKVQFKRIEDSADIGDIPVLDGQLIYTKDGKQYMDYEQERVDMTSSGGGGTIDTAMSDTSTNAVQNRVIKQYVDSHSGGGITKTILWENPHINVHYTNWSSSWFITQETELNLTDDLMEYDAWEVVYFVSMNSNSDVRTTGQIPITLKTTFDSSHPNPFGTTLVEENHFYDANAKNDYRMVKMRRSMGAVYDETEGLYDTTKIKIYTPEYYDYAFEEAYGGGFAGGADADPEYYGNRYLQPLQIIGYKYS